MNPSVGFVILTHNKPRQIARLFATLNRIFNYPPIVCHHDFSKCDIPVEILTENIQIVRPYLQTGWGRFSLVEAMLRAIQLMYEPRISPDWFICLSEADYPIKPANQILQDLASSPYDIHIQNVEINHSAYQKGRSEMLRNRYCVSKFWLPFLNRRLRPAKKRLALRNPLLASPFLPFSVKFRCFAGEFWFCANRKAAKYLLEFHNTQTALSNHYRYLDSFIVDPAKDACFDESYFQTILCNAPHLTVSGNNWRYVDWSTPYKGRIPKVLLYDDLPTLRDSSAHFARKFDIEEDVEILNELDTLIG